MSPATCGWCKTKSIERDEKGNLKPHFVPGKIRVICSGYEHWHSLGRSR